MIKTTKKSYKFNLITLSHVNFTFDHMLVNLLVHTSPSLITKKMVNYLIFWPGKLVMVSSKWLLKLLIKLDPHYY